MLRQARTLLAAAPLAVVPVTPTSSTPAAPANGYVIAMNMTMANAGMSGPMALTLKAAGSKLRIEMDMSGMLGAAGDNAAAMMSGAFMLPQDDGRITMVLPNMQSPMGGGTGMGMIMDSKSLTGTMQDMGVSLEITDMKVSLEDLGAGESMLGHPTHHYKLTQKYQMGGKPYEGVSELWMTSDMRDAEAAFKKFNETFGMQFIGAATSKEVQAEIQSKTPPGFAMKMVVNITTPDGPQTMRMDVTKAERAAFDDAEFTVPAGIQIMDMSSMMKRG